jgi:hypothetical protein
MNNYKSKLCIYQEHYHFYIGIPQVETLNAFFSCYQGVLKIQSLLLIEHDEMGGVAQQVISLNRRSLSCELSTKAT